VPQPVDERADELGGRLPLAGHHAEVVVVSQLSESGVPPRRSDVAKDGNVPGERIARERLIVETLDEQNGHRHARQRLRCLARERHPLRPVARPGAEQQAALGERTLSDLAEAASHVLDRARRHAPPSLQLCQE
jgi:hypothetical protein